MIRGRCVGIYYTYCGATPTSPPSSQAFPKCILCGGINYIREAFPNSDVLLDDDDDAVSSEEREAIINGSIKLCIV